MMLYSGLRTDKMSALSYKISTCKNKIKKIEKIISAFLILLVPSSLPTARKQKTVNDDFFFQLHEHQ